MSMPRWRSSTKRDRAIHRNQIILDRRDRRAGDPGGVVRRALDHHRRTQADRRRNRGLRSVPALASSLAWLGFGAGGIVMGYIAERIGVRWTVMFGAVMICIGLALSTGGETWQLYLGQGLFMGFLGIGGMNAPFYVYVSRWFDRRRGSALALISSGSYVAGAIWPPIFERAIAYAGWQKTMLYYGLFEVAVVVPLAAIFLRAPPEMSLPGGALGTAPSRRCRDGMAAQSGVRAVGAWRSSSAASRWRCRRRICPRSAAISAFSHPTARQCCRCCWARPSSAASSGAGSPIASAASRRCWSDRRSRSSR